MLFDVVIEVERTKKQH